MHFGPVSPKMRAIACSCSVGVLLCAPLAASPSNGAQDASLEAALAALPISFEVNAGQVDPEVRFLARGPGYTVFLTPTETVLSLRSHAADTPSTIRMRLGGAVASRLSGRAPQDSNSHYFIGQDRSAWRTSHHYGRVLRESPYPGIDVLYYGRSGQLEYDFLVAPGADPRQIRLDFEGVDEITTATDGSLSLRVGNGVLHHRRPIAYQQRASSRAPVSAHYVLQGPRSASIQVDGYDPSLPLVIDPLLVYATYLGGSSFDYAYGVAVGPDGSTYVTGYTQSTNFPRLNAAQATYGGGQWDAFVTRLNASGSGLVYSTFLGGSAIDYAYAIAVDGSGNAYITGSTTSPNFPTSGAMQGYLAGTTDAFVTKLNASGSMAYSTYLGGSSLDVGRAIAVDGVGQATLTGETASSDFPLVNALYARVGNVDAFLAQLSASGSSLVYSTCLGAFAADSFGYGVAVDGQGAAYVTGHTTAVSPFPTTPNAFQATPGGQGDAFLSKVAPAGAALLYSTYLGGSSPDYGYAVAVDALGSVYVTGSTKSTNFPVANALYPPRGSNSDAFVTKFAPGGATLVFSTALGGVNSDEGTGVAADAAGNTYVAGYTSSDGSTFPVRNELVSCLVRPNAFTAKISALGSVLLYATCLGPGRRAALALDGSAASYVAGYLNPSQDGSFPTTPGAFQETASGSYEGYVVKVRNSAKGDINRDGSPDLVFRSVVSGAQNKVWFMNGTQRLSEAALSPDASSTAWMIRGIDDFNRDEKPDLVFWNSATGSVEFWFMNGATRFGGAVPLTGGSPLPTNWDLSATADFSRDGQPDIVWRDFATQKLVVWTMNGTTKVGTLIPTPDQAVDANWKVVAATDYNGDGATDFLWYNWSSGKIVTWYMNGAVSRISGQFTSPANAGDANWRVLAGGDYSGATGPGVPPSGAPDIVWRNETSGNQVVWHMNFSSTRVYGEFTNPTANSPALDWTIVGPR